MFGDLRGPRVDHVLMVGRVVADVAGDVLLFQAADAVLQAGRAGERPGPGQPLVALVRQERASPFDGRAGMLDLDLRQVGVLRESATARSRWRCSRRSAA